MTNPLVIIKTADFSQTGFPLRKMHSELPPSISVAARPTRPAASAPVAPIARRSAFGIRHSEFNP